MLLFILLLQNNNSRSRDSRETNDYSGMHARVFWIKRGNFLSSGYVMGLVRGQPAVLNIILVQFSWLRRFAASSSAIVPGIEHLCV